MAKGVNKISPNLNSPEIILSANVSRETFWLLIILEFFFIVSRETLWFIVSFWVVSSSN